MKYILVLFLLVGCVNKSEYLHLRVVTDKQGCEYLVTTGLGDTVFLNKLKDRPCGGIND